MTEEGSNNDSSLSGELESIDEEIISLIEKRQNKVEILRRLELGRSEDKSDQTSPSTTEAVAEAKKQDINPEIIENIFNELNNDI